MYETEANHGVSFQGELPADVVARFAESRQTVTLRTLIPWSEHCTECVWPTCFTTCDLYSPRADGKCRRFVDGMVRIDCPGTLNSYILRISFKRWGKLWSPANLKTYSLGDADRAEQRDLRVATFLNTVPIAAIRNNLTSKRYSMKKRWAASDASGEGRPNCLLIECYNPNPASVSITVTARQDSSPIPFQALLMMEPGFNRHRVAVADFERVIDVSTQFGIDLTPNEIADGLTLYFGAMDFVNDTAFAPSARQVDGPRPAFTKPCKCIVWDLDNTLWEGILVEDGAEKVRLRAGMASILKELDDRGILLSIASKNNHDEAMAVLRRFGLDEYFLSPQISWNPKSEGIQRIATSLNIGLDSILFVDDSPFEREQVQSGCRDTMVLDAAEYQNILQRPDCQAPVTEESKKRRLFYRDQERRDLTQKDFHGEYVAFLRDCNLRLTIRPMTEANLERVHELTQRTNQMNFSGNRYSRDHLRRLLNRSDVDTYVLDCEDRFGSYGTIGFCLIERREVCMTDLMFSCRIQAKRVEHAFLSHLIKRYRQIVPGLFFVNYRKSKKNAEPGKVFADLGFQVLGETDGVTRLAFPPEIEVPDDGIVEMVDLAAGVLPEAIPSSSLQSIELCSTQGDKIFD
jgi:FkbH-like protein